MFYGLPPGTILNLMYLYDRVKKISPGVFIEVGAGSGEVSKLLLRLGWIGTGIDLQPKAIQLLNSTLSDPIAQGRFHAINEDFMNACLKKVDLIISNQVMEHLSDDDEVAFIQRSFQLLKPNGKFIAIVPSAMKYWSIEDDVVGHYRRYEIGHMEKNLKDAGFKIDHSAGLNYPISNWLHPIASHLNSWHESHKLEMSMEEKTVLSGIRRVPFKTYFPKWLNIILNSYTLYPFHMLQIFFKKNINSMNQFYEASTR